MLRSLFGSLFLLAPVSAWAQVPPRAAPPSTDSSLQQPTPSQPAATPALPPATPGPSSAPEPAAPPPAVAAPAAAAPAPGAPAPAGPSASAPRVVTSPGEALVHVAVSHRDAWLEMRSYVDQGAFKRMCQAPCDQKLLVDGQEARVSAPGMTTSNIFRFDPGNGVAGVRVDGGSRTARNVGLATLIAGMPIALAGMTMFAFGRMRHESGLTGAGIAGLAVGGVSIGVSLPLLLLGTTHVKDAKGSLIATSEPSEAAKPRF